MTDPKAPATAKIKATAAMHTRHSSTPMGLICPPRIGSGSGLRFRVRVYGLGLRVYGLGLRVKC